MFNQAAVVVLIPALAIILAFFGLVFGLVDIPTSADLGKVSTMFFASVFSSFALTVIATIKGE